MESFSEFKRPTASEFDRMWATGLITVDANVLLALYDLTPESRRQLLAYLETLEDGRLWLAHQAMLEFHRHRLGRRAQMDAKFTEVIATVRNASKELRAGLGQLPGLSSALDDIAPHLERVRQAVSETRADHSNALGAAEDDAVLQAIERVFAGRIGGGLTNEDVEQRGAHRYAREIPPGYGDEGKALARRYGDLHIWLELLQQAKAERRPVLFLTKDGKDDWWSPTGGAPMPRPELRREMFEVAGVSYWQYSLEDFLREATRRGAFDDDQIADEVEEIQEQQNRLLKPFSVRSGEAAGWSSPPVRPLARRWRQPTPTPVVLTVTASNDSVRIHRGVPRVTSQIVAEECVVRDRFGMRYYLLPQAGTVRFPQDFGDFPLSPGEYDVRWTIEWDDRPPSEGHVSFGVPA